MLVVLHLGFWVVLAVRLGGARWMRPGVVLVLARPGLARVTRLARLTRLGVVLFLARPGLARVARLGVVLFLARPGFAGLARLGVVAVLGVARGAARKKIGHTERALRHCNTAVR